MTTHRGPNLLEGKVALVTGAASGLGHRIMLRLAEAGAAGIAFDRNVQFSGLPGNWHGEQGDVSVECDVAAVVDEVRKRHGRLDVVVANAGVVPPWRRAEDYDFEEWDTVFAVNVKGVALTIKHSVSLMKKTGGSIIAMGSLNSQRAHGSQCLYTATKHAVLGIVRSAALDLGEYNIRVNALGPGPVATEALLNRLRFRSGGDPMLIDDALKSLAAETALGRLASEDNVAAAAVFLASDESAGISGQILPIDAGLA